MVDPTCNIREVALQMTPATSELFSAIVSADITAVQNALAAGADVNATDGQGRNVVSYAALGAAIDSIDSGIQPRLSERRLDILHCITQQSQLSLYSLNAPMAWAGGVTLLSLMSWLNMPSELMCLLDFTHGLLEVNAMDDHGATPLMYAARDGNLQVTQRLLAHGARPDLKDVSQRSAIEYALPHPQLQWLCEEALRRSRKSQSITSSTSISERLKVTGSTSRQFNGDRATERLFFSPQRLLSPPSMAWFDGHELRRQFDTLLRAIRHHDVDTFRSVLFSTSDSDTSTPQNETPSFGTFFLVNARDSTGLTLTHHVVCQRPCPNVAILDALHSAGSDVGLFSTLGFSPLHHLSRTARDAARAADPGLGPSRSSLNPRAQPLYTFTMHLIRDLRAPLRATDNKGETPLHTAAEHGRSLPVLLAMLDCDREFSGKAAVREMRNERGLRPVDVAKSEFIPLFLGRHQSHPMLPSDLKRKIFSPHSQPPHPFGGHAHGSLHSRSTILMRQESHGSLMSKSSGSSSRSSGARSIGSQRWSSSHRSSMRTASISTLLTPEATPTGSSSHSQATSSHESYFPIDAPAYAVDVLNHLSFCANALDGYTQLYARGHETDLYDIDVGTLPEFHVLADLLLLTRDLASHVLEHWTVRLESVREEFDRARRELGKTKALREQIGQNVKPISSHPTSYVNPNDQTDTGLHQPNSGGLQVPAGVQTDLNNPASADNVRPTGLSLVDTGSYLSGTETASQTLSQVSPKRPSIPRLRVSTGWPHTRTVEVVLEEDTIVTGPVNLDQVHLTSELVSEEDSTVRREAVGPTFRRLSDSEGVPFPKNNVLESELLTPKNVLMVPMILHRADQDLSNVLGCFAIVQQSYAHAQQSIAQTRALVEESIKVREEKLAALMKIYHKLDVATHLSRLSPIFERSPEAKGCDDTASNNDPRLIAALGPIEESQRLRRLLMRKLAKHVEKVCDSVQKAHVWLRIIREVLRGLRRRALVDDTL